MYIVHCKKALSVKYLQRLQFHIMYMLTIRNFTHSHPTSLTTVDVSLLPSTFDEVYAWLTSNRLFVKPSNILKSSLLATLSNILISKNHLSSTQGQATLTKKVNGARDNYKAILSLLDLSTTKTLEMNEK